MSVQVHHNTQPYIAAKIVALACTNTIALLLAIHEKSTEAGYLANLAQLVFCGPHSNPSSEQP
ncbi:hypothetical protein DACRYDRAFT_22568 [Dacryopinax primogenitus]|uniref:Uncharacterized protein n=1 Tax=Dacryopinax primogenitus (strain DJM 731) TaxID=1858805 RepID=M5FY17_DACPD|nr:uncharacterized protein DACRYDRAFT_22568 [Dacryopinax primogenitus]EJU01429.1 hypothetical protein DACRYDRAFT_22568 [Dacryopinax primogenitus]